jgi:hypothetical protein
MLGKLEMNERERTDSDLQTRPRLRGADLVRRQAPYLAALVLALAGVAYTNVAHRPLTGYWEFLALCMAVMCVVTQWDGAPDKDSRARLIGTQALHWAAVLVAMNILLLDRVQSMMPAPSLSLVLLVLLALGTFLAGVSFLSVQICFLGLAMALAVPAIAWLTQSFLFLALALILLAGLGVALWPSGRNQPADK